MASVSVLESASYMHDTLLRDVDTMSMAHSLEVRVPFLNWRLAVAVASAPAEIKLGARPKPLLLDSVPSPLPDEIVNRKKGTFTLPFDLWMRGPLRDYVEAQLATVEGLDPAAVRKLASRFDAGEPGINWTRVWAIADLAAWQRENRVPDSR